MSKGNWRPTGSQADNALSMKLQGMRELHEQLKELGAIAGVKVLAKDARKAMAPVVERARAKVPVDTGLTRDNIKVRVQKPKKGNAVVIVGVTVAKSKEQRPSKHRNGKSDRPAYLQSPDWRWHFTELGTATQPARPFLRPAFNVEGTLVTLKAELNKDIKKVISKRAKLREAAQKARRK